MSESEKPTQSHRRKKRGNGQNSQLVVTVVLLLIIAAGIGYYFLSGSRDTDNLSRETGRIESSPGQDLPVTGQVPVPAGTGGDTAVPPEIEDKEMIAEPGVPGPVTTDSQDALQDKPAEECELLGNKLYNFFIHIDTKEYLQPFALKEPSLSHFTKLAQNLLENPPVVSRESDDLYTILQNMAHFFRIIGKDNILLIKAILDRERDKIEDVASELYQWMAIGNCSSDRLEFAPPLEEVYEYAGFFLNTMGGRSYLFRRDSRSRMLVNYYSILIVASANEKGLNRYGIDISLLIPQLIQEIEATTQLIYKENYLDQLYSLLEKYQ